MFVESSDIDVLFRGTILSVAAMLWVVILVRVNGLRSFSKMTNFDFVMTVAIGSLVAGAGQSSNWGSFAQILTAMGTLFVFQYLAARCRKSSDRVESMIQNTPILLMRNGAILPEALKKTRVAESDLIAKLREANVLDFRDVRAVVLETTGDISVLHGEKCSEDMLSGTIRITPDSSS